MTSNDAAPPCIDVPTQEARTTLPVPSPVEHRIVTVVEDGQEISEEQRARVAGWLTANGISPQRVVFGRITLESKDRGGQETRYVIGFSEYYEDADGRRVINERTLNGALTYERWVVQTVPLAGDPTWNGWKPYYAALKEGRSE